MFGTSGSGKTQLASELAKHHGCTHLELDEFLSEPTYSTRSPKRGLKFLLSAVLRGGWLEGRVRRVVAIVLGSALLAWQTQATTESQKLVASNAAADDEFGFSIAIDGDAMVIGARDRFVEVGAVYVFRHNGSTWVEEAYLTSTGATSSDFFGSAVAIDGDRIVVGSPSDDDPVLGGNAGSAYVFDWNGSAWTQTQKLLPSALSESDDAGSSVAISGDRILIGSPHDDIGPGGSGAAYTFLWNGSSWVEEQQLLADDRAFGDNFGHAVALEGTTAVITAPFSDNDAANTGSIYRFEFDGSSWSQVGKHVASDREADDYFGRALAFDGVRALVTAWGDDDLGTTAGAAYILEWNGTSWVELPKLHASDGATLDQFGRAAGIDGGRAVVGATLSSRTGAAYVFHQNGSTWSEADILTASDDTTWDRFALSLALENDTAVVGAYLDDDAGSASGSAYVYAGLPSPPPVVPTLPWLAQGLLGLGLLGGAVRRLRATVN